MKPRNINHLVLMGLLGTSHSMSARWLDGIYSFLSEGLITSKISYCVPLNEYRDSYVYERVSGTVKSWESGNFSRTLVTRRVPFLYKQTRSFKVIKNGSTVCGIQQRSVCHHYLIPGDFLMGGALAAVAYSIYNAYFKFAS